MRQTVRLCLIVLLCSGLVFSAVPASAQDPAPTEEPTEAATEEATEAATEAATEEATEATTETATQASSPATTGTVTHTVQPNENLFRISLRYGVTVRAIADANGIANPNLIVIGRVLNIPGGVDSGGTGGSTGQPATPAPTDPPATGSYTVVAGDTLSAIARRFNTSVQAIAQANNIANPNLILVGQVLNISGAPQAEQPTDDGGDGNTDDGGNQGNGNSGGTPVAANGFELGGHISDFGALDTMRSADMSWVKVQIRFSVGQNADITAESINAAHLNGFKILLGIVGTKEEMTSMGFDAYSDAYAEFVGNVARLGPEAIEVWNEPNIDREWPSGQVSPAQYTTLLQKSYEAIKAINGSVMVVSGAPAPTGFFGGQCTPNGCDDDVFIRGMASAGAANYLDCVGAHYNEGIVAPSQRSGDPRGNSSHHSRYFFGMLDLYHGAFGGKPVCWTELGYVTGEGFSEGVPAGFAWGADNTLAEHAQWLGEAATLSASSGRVRLMIVWNVNFTDTAPDPSGMYAILRPDGSCPACATLANAVE